jgi:transmembrane sensor
MANERIWLLISLQLSGEATQEELGELEILLRDNPEIGLQVEMMRHLWKNNQASLPGHRQVAYDKHLQRLSNYFAEPAMQFETPETDEADEYKDQPARRRWLWIGASAAAAVLVVVACFFMFNMEQPVISPKIAGNAISTKAGSKSKIQLPDGTQVWLNADSRLTYGQNFSGAIREVHLTGEAYFDVIKDKSRPFVIHTSSIDVRVLGTAFNVRSYPAENTTETALIRGSVEVTLHNNPDKKIILKPNEKLIVNNSMIAMADSMHKPVKTSDDEPMITWSKVHFQKKDTTESYETMWVKNKLAFENESFERMIGEMERWYGVQFIIKNDSLKKLHFTGVFENKSLTEVMDALRYSRPFQYQLKDGKVTVW